MRKVKTKDHHFLSFQSAFDANQYSSTNVSYGYDCVREKK